jgi:hypothetical protein
MAVNVHAVAEDYEIEVAGANERSRRPSWPHDNSMFDTRLGKPSVNVEAKGCVNAIECQIQEGGVADSAGVLPVSLAQQTIELLPPLDE